ncbi:hypothetical protein CLH62_01775 [Marinobacter guineae]|uniref:Uncharacterized protein n=1 Tax=Marinobacter guineae TaxID=432303 RepID=A0A2G1VI00_9GAMM|nr:glycosyltransferase family 4 protein [Marinobacter guineae]PHQ26352.1 hypothetical protein CLH62_01775 [Marinobacter guineae]
MIKKTRSSQNEEKVTSRNTRILLLYHCKANTGYAIETLERTFWEMAIKLTGTADNIHLCYPSYEDGYPTYVPKGFNQYFKLDPKTQDLKELESFRKYILANQIDIIFGFDQPPERAYYKAARQAGVSRIISYWGAPMSSPNHGLKLWLKRLQNKFYTNQPDLYIFESFAMQASAFGGRGIPKSRTSVCYLGVDTKKFCPNSEDRYYAHNVLGIDRSQKLIFYSGHFEPRKGVSVIVEAANQIVRERQDITFILFGNQPGQERPYAEQLTPEARDHIIFGGYRKDLNRIHRSCAAGVIASTGWDSFTVSSLEMQASALPLLVSDLPGLNETIEDGVSGYLFEPGNSGSFTKLLNDLLNDYQLRTRLSNGAHERIQRMFKQQQQLERLIEFANCH